MYDLVLDFLFDFDLAPPSITGQIWPRGDRNQSQIECEG